MIYQYIIDNKYQTNVNKKTNNFQIIKNIIIKI